MKFSEIISEFDNITVSDVSATNNSLAGKITLARGDTEISFNIEFKYSEDVLINDNIGGLILTMPVINFTLFAKKITLDFPVSESDLNVIRKFIQINNRDVFINKLVRRRYEFFRKEYLPREEDINAGNVDGITKVVRSVRFMDDYKHNTVENNVAILSSGGKESLLSYGMLNEVGANTFQIFFNESGAHWMTAKTAYDAFEGSKNNTFRIWSNVDRFYRFCLRNMKSIDQKMILRKTDTYPVQLFIFPVYVMSSLPILVKHKVASIVIGDEFDDPREMSNFKGFKHYYGIFDQSQDFNDMMSDYLAKKGIGIKLWSAVYPITASVVENILIKRYPDLFRLQRSCHSCRKVGGIIKPCGNCSKCIGIMLFVRAAGGKLSDIGYEDITDEELLSKADQGRMRLDFDELIMLEDILGRKLEDSVDRKHTQSVHVLPGEGSSFSLLPPKFRSSIRKIIEEYARDEYVLKGNLWLKSKPSE